MSMLSCFTEFNLFLYFASTCNIFRPLLLSDNILGVGKTTLIRLICSELLEVHLASLSLSGFYTEEVRDPQKGSRIGFDVVTLPGGSRGPLARVR